MKGDYQNRRQKTAKRQVESYLRAGYYMMQLHVCSHSLGLANIYRGCLYPEYIHCFQQQRV